MCSASALCYVITSLADDGGCCAWMGVAPLSRRFTLPPPIRGETTDGAEPRLGFYPPTAGTASYKILQICCDVVASAFSAAALGMKSSFIFCPYSENIRPHPVPTSSEAADTKDRRQRPSDWPHEIDGPTLGTNLRTFTVHICNCKSS